MAVHEQNSLLIHTTEAYTENLPVLDDTTIRANSNNDSDFLITNCCRLESVYSSTNVSIPDENSATCCKFTAVHPPHIEAVSLDSVGENVSLVDSVDRNVSLVSSPEDDTREHFSTKKFPLTFEIDANNSNVVRYSAEKSQKHNLQEAFLQFRLKKQNEARLQRQLDGAGATMPLTPARMGELREKIIAQAKKYFGVPYARKYWAPDTPEYNSPIFLDCCGLVRQVIRDLQKDLGFRMGPWNQAYMFDTLPVTLTKEQMKPGDLVFMSGVYVNSKSKKQLHNMVHVEIWLGDGDKTIGSRWNNGKVQVFDSYQFSPKSFTSEQYIFKSIDNWLMGICRSYCTEHPWRLKTPQASRKSVFNLEDTKLDEKANNESDDSPQMEATNSQDEDNNLDVINSTPLSHNVIKDFEHVSDCNDQALRRKDLAEKSHSEVNVYMKGTRNNFSNTKGWVFNHSIFNQSIFNQSVFNRWAFNRSARTLPIQNTNTLSKNTSKYCWNLSVHRRKQKHDFEMHIMKVRLRNQDIESAILPCFREDVLYNFTIKVFQELETENTTIRKISGSRKGSEKQSVEISAMLPHWCTQDENIPSYWKLSLAEADLIQQAVIDFKTLKGCDISSRHETRSISSESAEVTSTKCFQSERQSLLIPKNSVASKNLRATSCSNHERTSVQFKWQSLSIPKNSVASKNFRAISCPSHKRPSITARDYKLTLGISEEVGELHTDGSCDQKELDGSCEVKDDVLQSFGCNAKPSAKAENSLTMSSSESGSDMIRHLLCFTEYNLMVLPTASLTEHNLMVLPTACLTEHNLMVSPTACHEKHNLMVLPTACHEKHNLMVLPTACLMEHNLMVLPTACHEKHNLMVLPTACLTKHNLMVLPTACLTDHNLMVLPTACLDGINASHQRQGSSGLTSNMTCKSRISASDVRDKSRNLRPNRRYKLRNLTSLKAFYTIIPSRKRHNAGNLSSRITKTKVSRQAHIATKHHRSVGGEARKLTSVMRARDRNIPQLKMTVSKAHPTLRIIDRNLSCAKTYYTKRMRKCFSDRQERPNLAINLTLGLPNGWKTKPDKETNTVYAETKQVANLKPGVGGTLETELSLDVSVALDQSLATMESSQTQLNSKNELKDVAKPPIYSENFEELQIFKNGKGPCGVLSSWLNSNSTFLKNMCTICQHYFLPTLENYCMNSTQKNVSFAFKDICCNQTRTLQMQQFSDMSASDGFGNSNNNSRKDWCLDLKEFHEANSGKNLQIKLTSESEKINKHMSQNVNKQQVQMTSYIGKNKAGEKEMTSEAQPVWLRDVRRSKANEKISLSPLEKQREQSLKTAKGIGQSVNDYSKCSLPKAWVHCSETFTDALEAGKGRLQEMEDSSKHVARYILNQRPVPADDAGSRDSGFQSTSRGIFSTVSSEYSPIVVTENTVGICRSHFTSKDFDRADAKESCRAKPEDKKQDISFGPPVSEALEKCDDLYSFFSVENLNEFSKQSNIHPHSSRMSLELRQYLNQDTTSNDGGDDDDIDDDQLDEDGELKFFDAEKQSSRSLLENFTRSQCANVDDDDDDDDYADFCGSLKETGVYAGSACHLDLKSSLFPGGVEQPNCLGPEDGSQQGQSESVTDQRGDDNFLNVNIPSEGGAGDSSAGGGGEGVYRGDTQSPKIKQCCLSANMQPSFFIGGANGISLVEGPLLALGWRRTADRYDERYKLKWVENKSRINYLTFREGEQLVNHIPNCGLLTNKLGLLCSLQEYERITLLTKGRLPRLRMADFVPETYKLDDKVDREKFIQEYKDGETWICKPTGMNQGKGIFLLRSKERVDQLLGEREAKLNRAPLLRIVQRYISHPLLLKGRKFDIRSYMFIASTVPFLVLYHKGYVRLSCHKYSPEDNNLTTHLTNQFVQKKDPAYKDLKEDTAWTMDKLNDYINEHIATEKGLEHDWVYGALTKQMQRITLHCFNSVKHKLQCRMGYFDLYGLDFMVDSDMKVWLIEINANPALHTNCQALKDAIPTVVEEAIYLALECFEKSCKGQPLMPLDSLASYSVLYCGSSPNTATHREIRSVSPFKDITSWNRSSVLISRKRCQNFGARRSSCCLPQIDSLTFSKQPHPHRVHKMETDNNQGNAIVQGPISNKNKRVSITNSLPVIRLGMTPEPKPPTDGERNNLNKQKLDPPSYCGQKHQPVKETLQIGLLSEVTRKHSWKPCTPYVKKTRDNLFRGN